MPTTSYFWLLLRISPGCFFCLFLPMPFIQSLYILALPKLQTPRLQSHPLDESHGTKLGWLKASWHLEASRCQGSPATTPSTYQKGTPPWCFLLSGCFLDISTSWIKLHIYVFDVSLIVIWKRKVFTKKLQCFLGLFRNTLRDQKKKGNCRHLPAERARKVGKMGLERLFHRNPWNPFKQRLCGVWFGT